MTTATVTPFPGKKPAGLVHRSIPMDIVLGYLENAALTLDGLGEACRADPAIYEPLAAASSNIREAGRRLAGTV